MKRKLFLTKLVLSVVCALTLTIGFILLCDFNTNRQIAFAVENTGKAISSGNFATTEGAWETGEDTTKNLISVPEGQQDKYSTEPDQAIESWQNDWNAIMVPAGWGSSWISGDDDALQVYTPTGGNRQWAIRPVKDGDDGSNACLGGAGSAPTKYTGGVSYTVELSSADMTLANNGNLKTNVKAYFFREESKDYHHAITVEFFNASGTEISSNQKKWSAVIFGGSANGYLERSYTGIVVPEGTQFIRYWFSNNGSGDTRKSVGDMEAYLVNTYSHNEHTLNNQGVCDCGYTEYDLWVGDVRVTNENEQDVLSGDSVNAGKISFTPTNGVDPATLTLNGASFTQGYSLGGSRMSAYGNILSGDTGELVIKFSGNNTFVLPSVENTDGVSSITHDGKLTLDGEEGATISINVQENEYSQNIGIFSADTLTIKGDGAVKVVTGPAKEGSVGVISMQGLLVVEGGSLYASGEPYGIMMAGQPTLAQNYTATGSAEANQTTGLLEATCVQVGDYIYTYNVGEGIPAKTVLIESPQSSTPAGHTHDGITYEQKLGGTISSDDFASPDNRLYGNYYLESDYIIEAGFMNCYYYVESGDTVNLCLNGHTFDLGEGYIKVEDGGTLNICDCGSGGTITSEVQIGIEDYGIITNKGTLNLNGGLIKTESYFTSHAIYNEGNFHMNGGSVEILADDAIYNATISSVAVIRGGTLSCSSGNAIRNKGALYLANAPTISSSSASIFFENGSIYAESNDSAPIPYSGASLLINTSAREGKVIVNNVTESNKNNFELYESNFGLIVGGSDNPQDDLVAHKHTYAYEFDQNNHWGECSCGEELTQTVHTYTKNNCSCGAHKHATESGDMIFAPWKATDSMPTTSGNYCLTGNVTVDNTSRWSVPEGATINLCLNGKIFKIAGTDSPSIDGTVSIYDCGTTVRYYTDDYTNSDLFPGGSYKNAVTGGVYTYVENYSGMFMADGEVNIYGGNFISIAGDRALVYGTLNIYGGRFIVYAENEEERDGSTIQLGSTGTLNLNGKIDFGGNVAWDILTEGGTITVGGNFASDNKIKIKLRSYPTTSTPVTLVTGGANVLNKFEIVKDSEDTNNYLLRASGNDIVVYKVIVGTMNANGGAWADSSTTKTANYVVGDVISKPTVNPTRDGYTLKGWSLTADGEVIADSVWENNQVIISETNNTLYAIWECAHESWNGCSCATCGIHSHDEGTTIIGELTQQMLDYVCNGGGSIPPGTYYLTDNLTATRNLTVASGTTVTLCLNGKTLNLGDFTVTNEGTLTVFDCGSGGKVTSSEKAIQNGTAYNNSAIFNLSSGAIEGDDAIYNYAIANISGGMVEGAISSSIAIYNRMYAKLVITGGTIDSTSSNAIYGSGEMIISGGTITSFSQCAIKNINGSIYLSGNPTISGNETGYADIGIGKLYAQSQDGTSKYNGEVISVKMSSPAVNEVAVYNVTNDNKDKFITNDSGYVLVLGTEANANNLILHEHSYGYSASDNVLTESCSCGHTATATISAPTGTLVYDGTTEFKASVTYSSDWVASKDLVIAYTRGDTTTTDFTSAGRIVASITKDSKTATVTYDVAKVTVTKPIADNTSFTYTGAVQTYNLETNSLYAISNNTRTDAGTQQVTVALVDTVNYEWADGTTTDLTFEFKINPKEVVIEWADNNFTYNGLDQKDSVSARYLDVNGSPISLTVNKPDEFKNYNESGYEFSVSFANGETNYKLPSVVTKTYNIKKATYDMSGVTFNNKTVIYNGEPHSVLINGTLPNGVTVEYNNNDKTQVGSYTVIANFIYDEVNYNEIPSRQATLTIYQDMLVGNVEGNDSQPNVIVTNTDGFHKDITIEVTIRPTTVTGSFLRAEEKVANVFDITMKDNGVIVQPNGDIEIKLLIPSNLLSKDFRLIHNHQGAFSQVEYEKNGNYAVFTVNQLSDFLFVTEKETATISGVANTKVYDASAVSGLGYTYSGDGEITVTWFADNNGAKGEALTSAPTNAGVYWVTVSAPETDDYKAVSQDTKFTITKAKINKPTADNTVFTYNGAEQTYAVAPNTLYAVDGNTRTNAGSQQVTVALVDTANYEWADGTIANVVFTFTITKANAVITVDQTAIVKTYGETFSLPTANSNFGTVQCDKVNTDLVNAGSYTVTYSVTATDNYEGDVKTLSVTINKANIDMSGITFADDTVTYDGEAHSLAISGTLPNGVTVVYQNNGKTETGEYQVTANFIVEDTANYNEIAPMTATLTIEAPVDDQPPVDEPPVDEQPSVTPPTTNTTQQPTDGGKADLTWLIWLGIIIAVILIAGGTYLYIRKKKLVKGGDDADGNPDNDDKSTDEQ